MPITKIHNVTTGEVIEREMTDEEIEANKPIQINEPTVAEKLASVGLSLDDLREALGL